MRARLDVGETDRVKALTLLLTTMSTSKLFRLPWDEIIGDVPVETLNAMPPERLLSIDWERAMPEVREHQNSHNMNNFFSSRPSKQPVLTLAQPHAFHQTYGRKFDRTH